MDLANDMMAKLLLLFSQPIEASSLNRAFVEVVFKPCEKRSRLEEEVLRMLLAEELLKLYNENPSSIDLGSYCNIPGFLDHLLGALRDMVGARRLDRESPRGIRVRHGAKMARFHGELGSWR